jgi:leucyl/phenylalanyl-tRNA--protein transferase
MPVFELNDTPLFPPASSADESGIIAVGGDLTPERLIAAYIGGIFPWFSKEDPIIWWSPDPRFVLFPDDLKISKTMKQVLNRNIFEIKFDTSFREVITACSLPRRKELSTWITQEMIEAYVKLHEFGLAHSIEAWRDKELLGGLYGISLGSIFFGESMFSLEANSSKAAFITLVQTLKKLNFSLIDCQVHTIHLESLGAVNIPRVDFLKMLDDSLQKFTYKGNWNCMKEFTSQQS